ncbi:hypothetical protein AZH53_05830 [Methanomicrobiaceae archaeon CYW5]|uniref:V-type ATPase subunit n=1 Tax=Methanovulcanius yangii TaxID=1789227 RepID=UPI0029CA0009|nr:V-type ATPase subunit [Methanovulcanius yangii]MBT8507930.1 hypothetical protein [Methanovulcanius yangii]
MTDSTLDMMFAGLLGGGDGSAFLVVALVIAVLIALLIAASAGYFQVILNIAAFARPDARVRAIGNPMVDRETVNVVLEAHTLHDLFDRFRTAGHPFSPAAEMDIDMAEQSIRSHYYHSMIRLSENVPDSVRHFFRAYTEMLLAGEAGWIMSAKARGVSPADLERRASPAGPLTPEMIRKAVHAAGPDDAISRFSSAPFGPLLAEVYKEAAGDISVFSTHLHRAGMRNLSLAAREVDISLAPPVTEVAGRLVDVANIRVLARALAFGMERERTDHHLIFDGGFELIGERFQRARRAGSLPDLVSSLAGTQYEPDLSERPDAIRDENIPVMEAALDRCLLNAVRAVSNQYHLESGPLLRYLVALRYESQNMRAIANGVEAGLSPEEIEEVLVLEEKEE